ncbi:LOW QUALITY PROTEIN: uncharacterized protein ACR2FA_008730 [Aphomia sociella]
MAHMQYIPGDPRMVDQLVYELKSRGIFDQFRKDCIADVDTRPAYQNLRQRVENSVATFLSRQCWTPDLNKNQLREKLRKHILDGNYLEQGVERIVDQVVNPKVASVFIPQVEDLVYDFLGITRKKKEVPTPETSNGKVNENDLLPTDLEAVSPGSVKSNDDKTDMMDIDELKDETKMEVDQEPKADIKEDSSTALEIVEKEKTDVQDTQLSGISELTSNDSDVSMDKSSIPLPAEEIKPENIPPPADSPPKVSKVELDSIELPKEPNLSTDIPLPDEIHTADKDHYFKPINANSDDESSSDSSLIRNMSPLTPIRNFNNENSCDAQQAFESSSIEKCDDKKEPSTFRFAIESKSPENSSDGVKAEKKDSDQSGLSYQFNNQVNINTFNTPVYDDSSNSNLLHIDYESDVNSKTNIEIKVPDAENSEDSKKEKKVEEKKSSHKSSHNSRDTHRHSSNKDRRSDSKQSNSRDSSRHDKKSSSKDDHKSKSSHKEGPRDRSEKKDTRDSSKHRSSHKSSSHKDSKSHRSSSSSQRHTSSKHSDDKKSSSSSSSHRDKSEKSSEKSSRDTKEKSSKDSKSSSHRSDKDRKSSSSKSKHDEKDKKRKKETDDHYSLSGRGNHNRRSTDRDSNDGSSSSKGSNNPSSTKSSESKKDSKGTSKSDNASTSGDSTSPSDKEHCVNETQNKAKEAPQCKPIVRVENHLEMPIAAPPRLPFVPDVTLKKPKFAANLEEAKKLMKMRKFLDEEQKRMNQEAALLLEFQANVRPSLSQIYSSIPGPELEFACVTNPVEMVVGEQKAVENSNNVSGTTEEVNIPAQSVETRNDAIIEILTAAQQVEDIEEQKQLQIQNNSDVEETKKDVKDVEVDVDTKATVTQFETIENIDIPEKKDLEKGEKNSKSNEISVEHAMEYLHGEPHNAGVNNEIKEEIVKKENIINSIENIKKDLDGSKRTEYFEVTVITEELSETEDTEDKTKDAEVKKSEGVEEYAKDNDEEESTNNAQSNEIKDEAKDSEIESAINIFDNDADENFQYFGEHEKYTAELERDKFSKFIKSYTEKLSVSKMYLINCDTYEENILKEISQNYGNYEIVNYYRNGHYKLSKARNIVKDLNIASEISLPLDKNTNYYADNTQRSPLFSPVKSECSFELSSDYDAKLEEMVNKTSRKEIMEIILGSVADESPSKMPLIDYCSESNIESDNENSLKRKLSEAESTVNNNRLVLTSNKIRKLSGSDQISSTTEEIEESSNNNVPPTMRSKYLGRAKRVGLPRPKRTNLPNSPSSDKSIENYEQNTPVTPTPNGKMKTTPRNKVQRYDTSDLYKPKLHYLSRRNNIS